MATTAFFACLRSDVNKVNDFYLNQEEDVIILFHLLSVQVDEVVAAAAAAAATASAAATEAGSASGGGVEGGGTAGATTVSSSPSERPPVNVVSNSPALAAAAAAARTAAAAGGGPLRARLQALAAHLRLLANYAAVNYAGFYKILKKYDKKTGRTLRHTYLTAVLATPFFQSTTLQVLLGRTAERVAQLDALLAPVGGGGGGGAPAPPSSDLPPVPAFHPLPFIPPSFSFLSPGDTHGGLGPPHSVPRGRRGVADPLRPRGSPPSPPPSTPVAAGGSRPLFHCVSLP